MKDEFKIVRFDLYCNRCKHEEKDEADEPCNSCLDIPARQNTHVPEFWEARLENGRR